MKRWFSVMLLMGALLGLLAQEAAFASVLPVQTSSQTSMSAEMSADCAEMMGMTAPSDSGQQPDQPCQGLTPDCIAKMGCALPVVLIPPAASGISVIYRPDTPLSVPVAPLIGRDLSPEPHPPAHLG